MREWKDAMRARAPCAFLTRLADDAFALVYPPQSGRENRFDFAGGAPPDSEMVARAAKAASAGEPEKAVGGDGEYFIEPHPPTRRLVVVGATHIAQALIPFARATGFAPLVIDPRAAWATPERFAPTPVVCEWPQDALAREPVDSGCALVALTHDPKIDDPALASALRQSPRYVGALGGAQSNRKRVERLTAAGFSQAEIERIRAPVGIDIGPKRRPRSRFRSRRKSSPLFAAKRKRPPPPCASPASRRKKPKARCWRTACARAARASKKDGG